jgi:signal transduction histidine kinase
LAREHAASAIAGALTLPPDARRSWLIRLLDRLLWRELCEAGGEPLRRGRVMAGILVFMMIQNIPVFMAAGGLSASATMRTVMISGELACALGLVLMRAFRSLRPGAIVLALAVTSLIAFSSLHRDGLHVVLHPWQLIVPLMLVYSMGVRTALVAAAIIAVGMVTVVALHASGHVIRDDIFNVDPTRVLLTAAIAAVFAGAGLGGLHRAAQDSAHAALARAHERLKTQQANMVSLLENTDEGIALFDKNLTLLASNNVFQLLSQLVMGRGFEVGGVPLEAASVERQLIWKERFERCLRGERVRGEDLHFTDSGPLWLEFSLNPVCAKDAENSGMTLFCRDITPRVEADEKLKALHQELMDASRSAVMAEVASGVLHNVRNTLTSVTVAATVLKTTLQQSKVEGLVKASALLASHSSDLAHFVTEDERGRRVPGYIAQIGKRLVDERNELVDEVNGLIRDIGHIEAIVSMQQQAAKRAAVIEQVRLDEVIEDALRLNAAKFQHSGIAIERDYRHADPISVDRHCMLQILVNLLSNAHHALVSSGAGVKELRLSVILREGSVLLEVRDNGIGISAEDQRRIFAERFTTKKTGHGFGLHYSAKTAAEMGWQLSCHSDGPGCGAAFRLTLPREATLAA